MNNIHHVQRCSNDKLTIHSGLFFFREFYLDEIFNERYTYVEKEEVARFSGISIARLLCPGKI
jgi:hypothetical protein